MNRDDVIRWADEADLWADQELQCVGEYHPDWHEVRDIRFAALVAAAAVEREREACLRCYSPDDTATDWADKIRARGNATSRGQE